MSQFSQKVKLIFIPFVIVCFATVAVVTLLHWLLFIKYRIFLVDDDIINAWAPIVAPGIPILIWLRPRMKLLDLKSRRTGKDPLGAYIFVAWIIIAIPTVIAQSYLETATGKLTELNYISEIIHQPPTKYYTTQHYYVNKNMVHVKTVFDVSGKYNSDFNMTIYVTTPVFDNLFPDTNLIKLIRERADNRALILINDKLSDREHLKKLPADSIRAMRYVDSSFTIPKYGDAGRFGAIAVMTRSYKLKTKMPVMKISPVAWLAFNYSKTIDNNLSANDKRREFKLFADDCQADFNKKPVDKFTYLDRLPYGKQLKNYKAAIAMRGDVTGADPIILTPVYEPFSNRNGSKPAWLLGSFCVGSVIFLIMLLFKPLRDDALTTDIAAQSSADRESAFILVRKLFIPSKSHLGTQLLIGINILIFIIMVCSGLGFISFEGSDLLKLGANFRPLVMEGQYWRLFTNIFLHGGLLHVLFNMYGLFVVGIFLEPIMGTPRYIIAYLFTGIIASIASVWWHPATVSIGASGAIFGIYGIFLAYLTTNIFPPELKKAFFLSTLVFIIYNLLYGLTGGIDNAAHIGGLVSGLLVGYATYPYMRNKVKEKDAGSETQKILEKLKGTSPESSSGE